MNNSTINELIKNSEVTFDSACAGIEINEQGIEIDVYMYLEDDKMSVQYSSVVLSLKQKRTLEIMLENKIKDELKILAEEEKAYSDKEEREYQLEMSNQEYLIHVA